MAASYCTASDLHHYGLPRGLTPNPGRLAGDVDTSADTIALGVHGFSTDDPVTFRAEQGGSLPSPLVEGTTYYAISVSESLIQVAAAPSGAAIDLTTAGSRVIVIAPLPIAKVIAWASRVVDDMLPSHLVPLDAPFPELVVMTTAELAAGKLLTYTGGAAPSLTEMVDAATKRLERWARGVPVRGENEPPAADLAAAATAPRTDGRGWSKYGGL